MTKNEYVERLKNFVDKQHKSGKLPSFKPAVDAQGRSYEDNYYIGCLNCGRCMIVGECCDNRLTQNMVDKGE